MPIRKIHKIRFDALCYSRQPSAYHVSQEVEWFADDKENVLGIVLLDLVDEDWVWMILGRDGNGLFRAIEVEPCVPTREKAREDLCQNLLKRSNSGDSVFVQGDERKQKIELFKPAVTDDKFNHIFKIIKQGDGRLGKLAEFGCPDVKMMRMGTKPNHDPNAAKPTPFCVEVDPKNYDETWSEGVRIFHNPKALNPVPRELFPLCSHHYFRDGQRVAYLSEKFVFESKTMILTPKPEAKTT
jgi:hypothetical protein